MHRLVSQKSRLRAAAVVPAECARRIDCDKGSPVECTSLYPQAGCESEGGVPWCRLDQLADEYACKLQLMSMIWESNLAVMDGQGRVALNHLRPGRAQSCCKYLLSPVYHITSLT